MYSAHRKLESMVVGPRSCVAELCPVQSLPHGGSPLGPVTQSLSTCFKVFQRFCQKLFFILCGRKVMQGEVALREDRSRPVTPFLEKKDCLFFGRARQFKVSGQTRVESAGSGACSHWKPRANPGRDAVTVRMVAVRKDLCASVAKPAKITGIIPKSCRHKPKTLCTICATIHHGGRPRGPSIENAWPCLIQTISRSVASNFTAAACPIKSSLSKTTFIP
jgi:hypothetical protein